MAGTTLRRARSAVVLGFALAFSLVGSAGGLGLALSLSASCAQPMEPLLDVTPTLGRLITGQSAQLAVTRRYPGGPREVVTDRVTYVSSNRNVATVSDKGVVLAGTQAGPVVVRVVDPSSDAIAEVAFTVDAVRIASIDVFPSPSAVMLPGTAQRFTATAHLDNGVIEDVTNQLVWVSTNEAVAIVLSTGAPNGQVGTVSALAAGDTTITATDPLTSIQGGAIVYVRHDTAGLEALVVAPNPAVIPVGDTLQFSAVGVYSDGTTRDMTKLVGWSTSLPGVATVASGGLATGIVVGNVTITASAAASLPAVSDAGASAPDASVLDAGDGGSTSASPVPSSTVSGSAAARVQ